jgi:pimeloyl-ACP methyl ester carboxylesterase
MIEKATFIPTSRGPVSAVARVPESPHGIQAVLLLAGGRAGKTILKLIANDLADSGLPCLRFDYPGVGATSADGSLSEPQLVALTQEIASWWQETTGADSLALVGHCLGARIAIACAARDVPASCVVGIHLPVPDTSISRRIRTKVRSLDARGPKLASRFVPGVRVIDRAGGHRDDETLSLPEDLAAAATAARLRLLYGDGDKALTSFRAVVESLPQDAQGAVELVVKPDARLHGMPERDNFSWIRSQIGEALAPHGS